jgi:hypothetical protein
MFNGTSDPKKKTPTDLNDKQSYWDSLVLKYGKGVENKQIYIDLYDKPIKGGEIVEEHDIWRKDPRLKGKALQYQNQYLESEKNLKNWEDSFQAKLNNPQKADVFLGQDMAEQEYIDKFSPLTPEQRENNREYNIYVINRRGEFLRTQQELRDKFFEDPNSKTTYKKEDTSWRELIGGRNDIKEEDKALFYASLMDEGADQFTYNQYGGQRKPYDGFADFGLDTFGQRFDEFVNRGYVDKEMRNRIILNETQNEKLENVVSADFTDLNDVVTAKRAFIESGRNAITKKAKELNVNLSQTAKDYFTVASYNLGEGGARKMLEAYQKAGILENDKFMEDDSYSGYREPHRNAKRRVQAMNMLRGEGIFK